MPHNCSGNSDESLYCKAKMEHGNQLLPLQVVAESEAV